MNVHRMMKMNMHHQFTQLRVVVQKADDAFLPCGVKIKGEPGWRWLSLTNSDTEEMEPPDDDPKVDQFSRAIYRTIVRLLGKLTYHQDPFTFQYYPKFAKPYTAMESEVRELLDEETDGDAKAKHLISLWGRVVWRSILELLNPIMTCRNWDGSASGAGAGLLTLVSLMCMYRNLDNATEQDLASWPIGVDVAGAPKGHPYNVNVEYMVGEPSHLIPANLRECGDDINEVFEANNVRPTTSFTPDFALSGNGAVLVTGDGKSTEDDVFPGEDVMALVACRQFPFLSCGLGLTSTNQRFMLSIMSDATETFNDLPPQPGQAPPTFQFDVIRVSNRYSPSYDLTTTNQHPGPGTLPTAHYCTDGLWGPLNDRLRGYMNAVTFTIDVMVDHLKHDLNRQWLANLDQRNQTISALAPPPHYTPGNGVPVPQQDTWQFNNQSYGLWTRRRFITPGGQGGAGGPPPPPPPGGQGGAGGGGPPPPPPAGGAGGAGGHRTVQSQTGPSGTPGTSRKRAGDSGGGSKSKQPRSGSSKKTSRRAGSTSSSKQQWSETSTQGKYISGSRTAQYIVEYNKNNSTGNEGLWQEPFDFFDSKEGEYCTKSAHEILVEVMLQPKLPNPIRNTLNHIRNTKVLRKQHVCTLIESFLSEYCFDDPGYTRCVDFLFAYRTSA